MKIDETNDTKRMFFQTMDSLHNDSYPWGFYSTLSVHSFVLMRRTESLSHLPFIQPMEPIIAHEIPQRNDLIYQVKWDGIRLFAYVDHGKVHLYTKKQKNRTIVYPEIAAELCEQFPDQRVILDGECIVFHERRPDFYRVFRRDRMKNVDQIQQLATAKPVTYMVFDILYSQDQWLTHLPFVYRMKKLQSVLTTTPLIGICSSTEDGQRLLQFTKSRQWEGIVLKEKESSYHVGQRHSSWQKIKHVQKMEAYVIGVIWGSRRVSTLILGIRQDGSWHYIGKVKSGLTLKDLDLISHWVMTVQSEPPASVPIGLTGNPIIWVPPDLKVKLEFVEWTHAGTLRSPVVKKYSFQKKRVDR